MPETVVLSRSAERLIARHVDSVGALDLLLLVHGGRDRSWTEAEIRERLRCPPTWAQAQLARLVALGLLAEVAERRYEYRRDRRYGPVLDEIAHACRRDRSAVTRRIFARPPLS